MDDRDAILRVAKPPATAIRWIRDNETVVLHFMSEFGDTQASGWQYLLCAPSRTTGEYLYWEPDAPAPHEVAGQEQRATFYAVAYASHDGIGIWNLRKSVMASLSEYENQFKTITDRPYAITRKTDGEKPYYTVKAEPEKGMPTKLRDFRLCAQAFLVDGLAKSGVVPQ